jgi:hypothetical protein
MPARAIASRGVVNQRSAARLQKATWRNIGPRHNRSPIAFFSSRNFPDLPAFSRDSLLRKKFFKERI